MGSDSTLAAALARPGTVLLDGAGGRPGENRSLLFANPVGEIVALTADEVMPALARLDAEVESGRYVAGFLTYEAGEALVLEDAPETGFPLMRMWIYEQPPEELTRSDLPDGGSLASPGLDPGIDREAYHAAFERIRRHIYEGDVYQINLTAGHEFDWFGDPIALYTALRRRQPVAYGAFINAGAINAGEQHVLSFSPELFFRRAGDRIRTRPMKGTAARNVDTGTDAEAAQSLQADVKTRAENLMIVDLLRNDLSVVCRPGSVVTEKLFEVEALPTVWQMTSEISGELGKDATYADIFEALFPCGSITGAPKRRAMQVIRDIERGPRGVYCGAIGYAAPGGEAVFNVAIRTLTLEGKRGRLGTGGGIVADSRAEDEFDEMMLKASFFAPMFFATMFSTPMRYGPAATEHDVTLIETMKLADGTIPLIDLHLRRLHRSAAYFGIELDAGTIRRSLQSLLDIGEGPDKGEWKVRLTMDRSGKAALETSVYEAWPPRPLRFGIYHERVSRLDPWRYHKTTRREIFDRARAWASERGLDEALLLNEEGEVTEGTVTSIVIRKGRRWLTPRLGSGRLPGVALEAFAREEPVEEATLHIDDLRTADEILLMNALRGRVHGILL